MMSDLEALANELREARERRDLTLREVERKIHIRARYLEALESGQLENLPSPVQTRGFLRNYARFLGLDGEGFVARWDEALHGTNRRRRSRLSQRQDAPSPPASTGSAGAPARTTQVRPVISSAQFTPSTYPPGYNNPRPSPGVRPLSVGIGLVIVAVIAVMLVTGIQWVQSNADAGAGAEAILDPLARQTVTIAAQGETLAQTLTATATSPRPTLLPNPNLPPATPLPELSGQVIVQLEIVARTWLRVISDGQVVYLGAPGPNTVLQYQGVEITVRAANAGGVRALVNGRDLGSLGTRGQIVDQTFTFAGIVQASATP